MAFNCLCVLFVLGCGIATFVAAFTDKDVY